MKMMTFGGSQGEEVTGRSSYSVAVVCCYSNASWAKGGLV